MVFRIPNGKKRIDTTVKDDIRTVYHTYTSNNSTDLGSVPPIPTTWNPTLLASRGQYLPICHNDSNLKKGFRLLNSLNSHPKFLYYLYHLRTLFSPNSQTTTSVLTIKSCDNVLQVCPTIPCLVLYDFSFFSVLTAN